MFKRRAWSFSGFSSQFLIAEWKLVAKVPPCHLAGLTKFYLPNMRIHWDAFTDFTACQVSFWLSESHSSLMNLLMDIFLSWAWTPTATDWFFKCWYIFFMPLCHSIISFSYMFAWQNFMSYLRLPQHWCLLHSSSNHVWHLSLCQLCQVHFHMRQYLQEQKYKWHIYIQSVYAFFNILKECLSFLFGNLSDASTINKSNIMGWQHTAAGKWMVNSGVHQILLIW